MYLEFTLIFTIVLIITYYYLNKKEYFDNNNDNTIYGNKNVFVEDQKFNYNNININRLCIRDNKTGEIECLSKEELFNALELPMFRKHTICIDDACVGRTNFKKLNRNYYKFDSESDKQILNKKNETADETLLTNFKHIDEEDISSCHSQNSLKGILSSRKINKWEFSNSGRVRYNVLNKPKGGWKKQCRKKYQYRDTGKHGCNAKMQRIGRICWASSGGRCNREFKRRKWRMKNFPHKNNIKIKGSTVENIPILKENSCTDDNSGFKIKHGDIINDINLLNNPRRSFLYKEDSPHTEHKVIKELVN